jgi:Integrase core domain
MNRTLKEATVQRYHYESLEQLRQHLANFLAAYNFARRLKTLCGFTPHEYICKISASNSAAFRLDPCLDLAGLYS